MNGFQRAAVVASLVFSLGFVVSCHGLDSGGTGSVNVGPDLDEDCLKAGETWSERGSPPEEKTCCSDLVATKTGWNGSTGYTYYACIEKVCKNEGESVSATGTVCCSDLIAKDGTCINASDCSFNGVAGMLVYGNYRDKGLCVEQKACVTSGDITGVDCGRCCVGSKRVTELVIGGTMPVKCYSPNDQLPSEVSSYPNNYTVETITSSEEAAWQQRCLAY